LVRRWIVTSGVIRGWRDEDLLQGDPRLKTYSWERALWRLSLGAVTAPGGALLLEVPGAGSLGVCPLDFSAGQWPLLARVLTLVHGLRAFCEGCATPRTLTGWMEYLETALTDLVSPRTERDGKLLGNCLELLRQHARRPIWRLHDPPLTYAEVLPVVAAGFAALRTGHSPWGERGVWVGPLADLGLLPFTHVYFSGLEDGAVAREIALSALDVRSLDRLPGREPTAREIELGRFLTALGHVTGSVTLSWCDRDPSTGDPVVPATVVRELLEAVDPDSHALMQRPTAPVVLRSAVIGEAAQRLAKAGLDLSRLPLEGDDAEVIGRFLRRPGRLERILPSGRTRRLRWKDLSRFLQFPLQVSARTWFFSRREESDEPPEHEPEALDRWQFSEWYERIVEREIASGEALDDAGLSGRLEQDVESYLRTTAAAAQGPAGVYSDALHGTLLANLTKVVRSVLGALSDQLPDREARSGLRAAFPGLDPSFQPAASPPLRLPGSNSLVSGRLPFFHAGRNLLLLLDLGKAKDPAPLGRVCDAWIALQMHRLLAPECGDGPARVLLVRPFVRQNLQQIVWEWPMPDRVQALENLEQLARSLPDPDNLTFFTAELALEWLSGTRRSFEDWYGKRAPTVLYAWENGTLNDFRLDPVWNLAPLIDAPRAWALARRIYLDPAAPVARQFLEAILPVVNGNGVPPAPDGTQEDDNDDA
jgi:hypothetical protein